MGSGVFLNSIYFYSIYKERLGPKLIRPGGSIADIQFVEKFDKIYKNMINELSLIVSGDIPVSCMTAYQKYS